MLFLVPLTLPKEAVDERVLMPLQALGKFLMVGGVLLIVLGAVLWLGGSAFPRGLPGDVAVRRGNGAFYFPIVSCIVLSVVATVILNILLRLFNR